ncbi:PREDICTED: uncharacterized protein LOC108747942 [Trachymyrmex septentrionalis]|uniref:uncharacterized protein LOC108747942 n=1 Tax=Trachymyrmex septentrionalis TaxID=34720 RepID=UPI00084F668D|nr:PREDICTED: uncharacterized protein LOC108747942 [Trachymyrmex septentrionalis]
MSGSFASHFIRRVIQIEKERLLHKLCQRRVLKYVVFTRLPKRPKICAEGTGRQDNSSNISVLCEVHFDAKMKIERRHNYILIYYFYYYAILFLISYVLNVK